MAIELSELTSTIKGEMAAAGLEDTHITAMRLACILKGAYLLTIATEQTPTVLLPDVNPQHAIWVAAWLQGLPARIQTEVEDDYDE